MSKKTYIICDRCQKVEGGIGYSTLWARLRTRGWTAVRDEQGLHHFCPECCAAHREPTKQIKTA